MIFMIFRRLTLNVQNFVVNNKFWGRGILRLMNMMNSDKTALASLIDFMGKNILDMVEKD